MLAWWRNFRVQVGLQRKRSPTQCDIYQMLYWYNWFSWWWARGCSKRVDNWNKYIQKNCASSWSFTKNRSYYSTCMDPPLVPGLSQMNEAHILVPHFLVLSFILCLGLPKRTFTLDFKLNYLCSIYYETYMCENTVITYTFSVRKVNTAVMVTK